MAPTNPSPSTFTLGRRAKDVFEAVIGIKQIVKERSTQLDDLAFYCKTMGETLEEGKDTWTTDGLKRTGQAALNALDKVHDESQAWKTLWYGKQLTSLSDIDEPLARWKEQVTQSYQDYTISMAQVNLATNQSVRMLLTSQLTIDTMKAMSNADDARLRPQIPLLMDKGFEDRDTLDADLSPEERKIKFKALRDILTTKTVPSSVELKGDLSIEAYPSYADDGSDIYKGEWRTNIQGTRHTKVVAVKCLRDPHPDGSRAAKFLYEGALWRMLAHQNIVPFYGIYIRGPTIGLVSLWFGSLNVVKYLRQYPNCNRKTIVKGIADGIAYLHEYEIVHGSVCGSNICMDETGKPMLTNFGLAAASSADGELIADGMSTSNTLTTARWLAPELTSTTSRAPTFASDVFSFARTILEIMTGEKPFSEEKNVFKVIGDLRIGELHATRPSNLEVAKRGLTDEVWSLLNAMWAQDPNERPTMEDVVHALKQLMSEGPERQASELNCAKDPTRAALQPPSGLFGSTATMDVHNGPFSVLRRTRGPLDQTQRRSGRPHPALAQTGKTNAFNEPILSDPEIARGKPASPQPAINPARHAVVSIPASPTPDVYDKHNSEELSKVLRGLIAGIKVKEVMVERTGEKHVAAGAFGVVWQGHLLPLRELVAIKIPRDVSNVGKMQKRLRRELSSWSALKHENVLPLLGVVLAPAAGHLWLISPWMEKSNLREYMLQHPEADPLHMLMGVGRGLTYVHSQSIVHGDLKANNVLVDDSGQPRLMDFGMSLELEDLDTLPSTSSLFYGNARWLAPERLDPKRFQMSAAKARSTSSDVYAFGMVIYEVFSGQVPFHEITNQAIVPVHILEGKRPNALDDFTRLGFNGRLCALLSACWQGDPTTRPSTETVEDVLKTVSSETAGMREYHETMRERALRAEMELEAVEAKLKSALQNEEKTATALAQMNKKYEGVFGKVESTESELRRASRNLKKADKEKSLLRAQLEESTQLHDQRIGSMAQRESELQRRLDKANERWERTRTELKTKSQMLSACQDLFNKMKDATDGLSVNLAPSVPPYPSVPPFTDKPAEYFVNRVGELNSAILNFSTQLTTQANHRPNMKTIQGAICETLYVEVLEETVFFFGAEDNPADAPLEVQQTIAESSEARRQWILMTRRHLQGRQKAEDLRPAKEKLIRQVFRSINDKTYGTKTLLDSDTKFRDIMDTLCGTCIELAHDLGCSSTDLRILHFVYETQFDNTWMAPGVHPEQRTPVLRTEQFGLAAYPDTVYIKAVVACRQSPQPQPLTWAQ
ncbi:kinase-like protein [Calocera viscosa TUFC12733]|uniref:Kinase-like protein n=1 Tax=Calocera viscosa (strain TUFC12733) TaxID=1330018 RepID=A0A167P4U8_CALVF|nr:kinase-like protein [Calocera viscosa TUFC12733]